MLETLQHIDTQVFLLLHSHHTAWLDTFMMLFTGRFIWIPLYAAIGVLIFKTFGLRLGGLYALCIALAVAVTDQTCASLIRPIAERLRPSNPDNPLSAMVTVVDGYRGGRYGFPSCHAANSFALATLVSLLLRRKRLTIFMFIWAALNSYSRLYLGVHYPGDLLAGAAIGCVVALIFYIPAEVIATDKRRHHLKSMGKPLFYFSAVAKTNNPLGTGITRGDLLITVAIVTVAIISVVATL